MISLNVFIQAQPVSWAFLLRDAQLVGHSGHLVTRNP